VVLIAFWGESLLFDGVDRNIKTLRSLLVGVQIPSYCYENPKPSAFDKSNKPI
jgi:hypothetical protein